MVDFPQDIPGEQLVYSNVEAEHSASHRRGFQVWLVSPGLRDQQREIARRLEDFDWPTPDTAKNFLTERHCFFPLQSGRIVIARTVPLLERDVLNRAGRFHAHAVVLTPESFHRIHCNPFAVWDHFPFQNDPKAAIAGEKWKHDDPFGRLPIRVGPPHPPTTRPDALASTFRHLVQWLNAAPDPRAVSLAVPPAKMLDFCRALFAVLPADLRGQCWLDTLSTGLTLNTQTYRLAGAYDAATLRDWPYRRSYKLDLNQGEFSVVPECEPEPALDHLSKQWLENDELTDADRTSSYRLWRGLQPTNPGPLPEEVSEQAARLVREFIDVDAGFRARVRDRLRSDLFAPRLLEAVAEPLCQQLGHFSAENLQRIRQPLPTSYLAQHLRTVLEEQRLNESQAVELEAWTKPRLNEPAEPDVLKHLGELFVLAQRWGPERLKRLRELHLDPQWQQFCESWFLTWLCRTSATISDLFDTDRCDAVITELFRAVDDASQARDDAAILLAWDEQTLLPLQVRQLQFVLAMHQGDQSTLEELLRAPGQGGERNQFRNWVFDQVQRYDWETEYIVGNVEGHVHPGLLLRPRRGKADTGMALLDACANETPLRRQLMNWLAGTAPEGYASITDDHLPVDAAVRAYERAYWNKLHDLLCQMTPAEFAYTIKKLIGDKIQVHSRSIRTDHGVWLGWEVASNNYEPQRFVDVYETILNIVQPGTATSKLYLPALLFVLRHG